LGGIIKKGFSMNFNKYILIYLILIITTVIFLFSLETDTYRSDSITKLELSKHVHYLASDELEGRRAGTEGALKAAEYIAHEFMTYGLLPHPDTNRISNWEDYLQPFEFGAGVQMGKNNNLSLTIVDEKIDFQEEKDFQTLPFSSSDSINGEIIFAGFGISAKEENYDDYKGVSLEGKIALIFQGSPDINDPHGILNRFTTPRYKTIAAREAGARGLIIISQPDNEEIQLMRLGTDRDPATSGLPVINITPKVADILLENSGYTSLALYNNLLESRSPNSFNLNNIQVNVQTDLYPITAVCNNVIGYLPGNHPEKKNEFIVIGAHYDHLGLGGQGSMAPNEDAIHYGADDNASGTAGLLELAQKFSAYSAELDRSMLFIAFGAEELGLIGSNHYVENPYIPIGQTIAMINLDMIGLLRNKELVIFGVGSSPVWESLIGSVPQHQNFEIRTNPDGLGPSDHASFYRKDIPVLFFHTGLHGDYHRPSDTADKINYEGMKQIVEYVYQISSSLSTYDELIAFTRTDSTRPTGTMRGIRVYVGTMPDLVSESGGMGVTDVRKDSPADKAGIKAGDKIIKFGGKSIENVYDYTYALGDFSPGDIITVVVLRDNEELALELELGTRQQ
jgi:aminopeptidase YwaD